MTVLGWRAGPLISDVGSRERSSCKHVDGSSPLSGRGSESGRFGWAATRRFHPSLSLAVIVTTALVGAYAAAAYVNHLALIPRLWRPGYRGGYVALLTVVMVALTASALAVIRVAYLRVAGPDPDPHGVYKHFAMDLCGMGLHLVAVAAVVGVIKGADGRPRRCHPRTRPGESAVTGGYR
jgi:hypothetical protein